jgi:hypothetical protein
MGKYEDISPATIYYPPRGHLLGTSVTQCIPYGDSTTLEFDDPGVFLSRNGAAFEPPLPPIYLHLSASPVTLGPLKATYSDQDITTTFFDFSNGKLYEVDIQIRATCPSPDIE